MIYSVIGALPYISGIILIPFFTANLTTDQFGINVIYWALMVLFQVFAGFSMEALIGVYYFEFRDNQKRLRELLGMVLIISLIIGGVLLLISSILGPSLFRLFWPTIDSLQFFPYGLFTLLTAIFNAGFKFYSAMLICQQRPDRFLVLSLLNFILTIGLSLVLLYCFPYTLTGPILGRMIPAAITFCLSIILIKYEFGLSYSKDLLQTITSFCIPIVVYSFLLWIVNNIDRFVILHFIPDASYVGIFDIAVKITLFLEIFQLGLTNAINPKIFAIWKDQQLRESTVEVNRYYNGFTAITLIIIPLILISAPILIPLVIKKTIYYQALTYLPILTLGFVTRGWFYMFIAPIYFFKKTRTLPKIFFFSACFQIASSILLVKYFGIMGAVWGNFLIKPVQAFFLYLESRKIFTFHFNRWKIIYLPLLFIGIVIGSEIFATEATRMFFFTGQLIVCIFMIFLVYRKELMLFAKEWLPHRAIRIHNKK